MFSHGEWDVTKENESEMDKEVEALLVFHFFFLNFFLCKYYLVIGFSVGRDQN